MKTVFLAGAAVAALAAPAFADPAAGIDAGRLSQHIKVLASDEFEGRGPATAGEVKAVAYVTAQMKAAGLQPGGDKGKDGKRGWTQAVPLGRFEIKGPMTMSANVGGKTKALVQGQDVAIRANMTNQSHVSFKDLPVVFLGYGVKAPERNWDDFKGMDLKGKIGLVLINDPDFETGKGDFGGKAMTYYGRWTYKYEEAARQGLAGLLVIHETAPASYGWATVKNSNANVQFDIVRKEPAKDHPLMEGWIQRDDTVELLKAAGLDFETLKKEAQTRDFKPAVLNGVTLSADYDVDHKVITSHNVVGRLPGTKRPDETVIYSAHWDHLGVGQPDAKDDKIYNGAVDNASGTASLLEMARAFAKAPRTERSVVFLSVTAEEKGLLGSEYYAANPLYPLATTVADINMDGGAVDGPSHDMTASGVANSQIFDDFKAVLKTQGRAYSPDPQPEAGHFYRSDHFPFSKRGVPAISPNGGFDLVKGGVAAGKAADDAYTRDKYHQPADEWSANWDLSGMVQDDEALYALGRGLANSRAWPAWYKDAEFAPARAKSAAQRK